MTLLEDEARSIFLDALDREPDQWAAFVASACAADGELRAKVDQLLSAHRELGIIKDQRPETPPSSPPARESVFEGPGTIIGPYRLLEQIGEGGFGIVYMAEQFQPMRRKVALKIIKPGMDTRRVVARFEAERQALALMDHPNIAQVFDGGATATGRPFFVMELVRGIPITDFCDQNVLPVRQRIELFLAVCKAVQHAHQKGIIHRDLKPSNVMVTMHDDKQVVKVIDFGIAKAVGQQLTEKTLFTNFAQMIGTPLYMSPEQAQMSGLDVDTRSDIYAMGVLLYELLTGTTPFDQGRLQTVAIDEIRRILREEEPPRPSTRLNSEDAETTSASLKRGSDPRRLSQLIRGELDWIVMKCLEKDRNRRYETANALALDLGRYLKNEPVQACPPSLAYRLFVFSRRYKASIGTAVLLLTIALVGCTMSIWQAFRAVAARDAAVRAELALSKTRQSAAEERANTIARDLETLSKANSLIESGRSHVDFLEWAKAEADLTLALKLRPDHSSAWITRGDIYARLSLWDLAAADFQQAFELQQPASVNSLYLHALLRLYMRDEAGYRAICEQMVKRFDNPGNPRAWEKEDIARACLLAEEPILAPERLVLLTQGAVDAGRSAIRLASLGTALYRARQYELAAERLQEAKPANPLWETSWTDSILAMTHHRLGRSEQARKALQSAADSLGRRLQFRSDNQGASPNAQWWYEAQGDLYFREAKRLIEGAEPKDDPRQWSNRGDALVTLGRHREGIASYRRATELDPAFHLALSRKAEVNYRIGDWPNVLRDYERLQVLRPRDASATNDLAWTLCTCPDLKYRDYGRAVELARKAVALAPSVGIFLNTLAVALYRTEDWAGSLKASLKTIELKDTIDPIDWFVLAMCEWHLDQKDQARRLLLHALRRSAAGGDQIEEVAEFRSEALALIGQPDGAISVPTTGAQEDLLAFTLLLEIEPSAGWIHGKRAAACARLKQWDQAAADLTRATEAHPWNPHYWYGQAVARLAAGDLAGYCKTRSDILKHFRDARDPWVARHLCYCSSAAPAAPEEAEAFLRLAEFGVSGSPVNVRIRGAMYYRAGRYEAAIADLNQSSLVFPQRAWDWLFLAMAHHKLGHAAEAQRSLTKAQAWIDKVNGAGAARMATTETWIGWYEPVEVEHLLGEAKSLLGAIPLNQR